MRTSTHEKHIQSRIAHNDCQECRADTERRFVDVALWRYDHVSTYLAYTRLRLNAIRNGERSADANNWLRKYQVALHRRITLKVPRVAERKQCDSYLERMGQFPKKTDAAYLRRFSQRGASCLQ